MPISPITKEKLLAFFESAGFKILAFWELSNEYWPNYQLDADSNEHEKDKFIQYQTWRQQSPWWLVKTEHGLIKIGKRKKVVSIDWADVGISVDAAPNEEVTKDSTYVHAWSDLDVIRYLARIRCSFVYAKSVTESEPAPAQPA